MDVSARFHVAHATGSWPRVAESCLSQLGEADGDVNFGFVYVTDLLGEEIGGILALLRDKTGIENWVGTIGVGVCATSNEYFDVPAVAVMTTHFPPDSFRVFTSVTADFGAFRRDNAAWIESAKPKLALVHGDPRNPRLPALVEELSEASSAFLVGGLTSSRRGYEQIAGAVTQGGVSGVLFSGDVAIVTGLTQGCRPIGPVRTVTAGFANVLAELDGRPALDMLATDSGEQIDDDFARRIASVEAGFPVEGSDTGDFLVRNLIGIDIERGLLVIGEKVSAGDKLMFVRRDEQAAREDMQHMLTQLRRRTAAAPKGGIFISCVGRGPAMFTPANRELEMIKKELGDFPLVGFSANGEICNNRLYGYTGVLALFL